MADKILQELPEGVDSRITTEKLLQVNFVGASAGTIARSGLKAIAFLIEQLSRTDRTVLKTAVTWSWRGRDRLSRKKLLYTRIGGGGQ